MLMATPAPAAAAQCEQGPEPKCRKWPQTNGYGCGLRADRDSPNGERTATGHLRLLLDVSVGALLLLLLAVKIDR